jgi:membrane protein DedA with SNARE-associated domain
MPDIIAEGLPILAQAFAAVGPFKYVLIFVGGVIEGPILTVATGFLLHSDLFELLPLFLALALGDLAGDAVWYWVGRRFAGPVLEKHGRFMTLTPEMYEKIKEKFHKHHSLILFTSKLTMGFGMALAMLMTAGASKIPFRSYMFWNALGETIYLAALLSLGYFLGNLYGAIEKGFKTFFVVTSAAMILGGLYLFSSYLRKRAIAK